MAVRGRRAAALADGEVSAGRAAPASTAAGGAPATTAGVAAIGLSAWRPIGIPHTGQKRSSLPWIAAHRGHAAMPASRSTVTGWRSPRAPPARAAPSSKLASTPSFAATSSSWRSPRRCISNTSPPRSRYASSRALRRKRTRRRMRPRSRKPGGRGCGGGSSIPAGGSPPVGASIRPELARAPIGSLGWRSPIGRRSGLEGDRGVAGGTRGLSVHRPPHATHRPRVASQPPRSASEHSPGVREALPPSVSRSTARRARGPRSGGLGRRGGAPTAARQTLHVEGRAQRPRDASERVRVYAHGSREHRHVARQRLQHRQAEALRLRGHQHGVGRVHPQRHLLGGDAAEGVQAAEPQTGRAASAARAVVALAGARGVGGEQQAGGLRVQAQLGAGARAGIGWKRSMSTPHGSTCARRRARRARAARARAPGWGRRSGPSAGSTARVARRVRGWRTSVPCTVSPLHSRARRERRPRGEAEVGVHDIQAPVRVSSPAVMAVQPRAASSSARAAGGELVQLDLHARAAGAARRPGRARSDPARGGAASGSMLDTTSARTTRDGSASAGHPAAA